MPLLDQLREVSAEDPPFVKDAFAALAAKGLPNKKSEAWRFTPLRHLVSADIAPASPTVKLELVEGATALSSHPLFGAIAGLLHFDALNAAMHRDAKLVRLATTTAPLVVRYPGSKGARFPRLFVEVAANQEATLVEYFDGESEMCNPVVEIALQPGARLKHVRIHQDAGHILGNISVRQDSDSYYESHVVSFGGALTRLDLKVDLAGKGASCNLRGAYHVNGKGHVDHHVRVDHRARNGTSHQDYRGLVDDKGTAVFDGQAIVHRTGGGAEAHQSNRNLLLAETGNVFTKPHLEIDHDEVIASHGATVGALDEDQIFYLRSRGIDLETARAILTYAFVRALLDEVPDNTARELAIEEFRSRLGEGALLLEDEPES